MSWAWGNNWSDNTNAEYFGQWRSPPPYSHAAGVQKLSNWGPTFSLLPLPFPPFYFPFLLFLSPPFSSHFSFFQCLNISNACKCNNGRSCSLMSTRFYGSRPSLYYILHCSLYLLFSWDANKIWWWSWFTLFYTIGIYCGRSKSLFRK